MASEFQQAARAPGQTLSSPNTANARKSALVMGLFLFAYVLATPDKGGSKFRRVYSTAVVFLFLALLADFAPQVAGPMSVLIVLGLIITPQGQAAFNRLPIGGVQNAVITKPDAAQNRSNAAK